jgi:hypothetical protein
MVDLRNAVRRILLASLLGAALFLGIGVFSDFSPTLVLLALTAITLVVGSTLAYVDLRAAEAFPRAARVALGLLLACQIAALLLLWTGWIRDPLLWRVWWACTVAAVTSAHVLGLSIPGPGISGTLLRGTVVCALLSGAWLLSLSLFQPFPPQNLPRAYLLVFVIPAVGSILGSALLWRRRTRLPDGTRAPLARWARAAWSVGAFTATFMAGWYVGGGGKTSAAFDLLPSALAGIPSEQVDRDLRADVERYRNVAEGLERLAARVKELQVSIEARQRKEGRTVYLPEEDDRIRSAFMTYLSYRAALLRLVATYAGFEAVREPELRARCLTLGTAAAVTAFENAVSFVRSYRDNANARRKLNEAEPAWGLSAGMFDRIYDSVTDDRHLDRYHEMVAYYDVRRNELSSPTVWPSETFSLLDRRIQAGRAYLEANGLSRSRAWLSRLGRRVKQDTYKPIYAAQSVLSTWIGDTKIVGDAPLIRVEQIRALRLRLKAGDILIERRNWYLSNAFLPGFWPHAALYVGTPKDLRRLGIADAPEVRTWADRHAAKDVHGESPTVIESVSEGVILNTLSHSMHADHVAVFRPRVPDGMIGQAIVRAFTHLGKPYDFEFDFFTSHQLVCTELVYRAYEGFIHFDLVRVMGRDTLPALEIVRKWARERTSDRPEIEFVAFLDGDRLEGTAHEAGEPELEESIGRPAAFGQ